jgi:hypothetical protein
MIDAVLFLSAGLWMLVSHQFERIQMDSKAKFCWLPKPRSGRLSLPSKGINKAVNEDHPTDMFRSRNSEHVVPRAGCRSATLT